MLRATRHTVRVVRCPLPERGAAAELGDIPWDQGPADIVRCSAFAALGGPAWNTLWPTERRRPWPGEAYR